MTILDCPNQKHHCDIAPQAITQLRQVKLNSKWSVTDSDKGIGPVTMETNKFFKAANDEPF